MMEAAHIEKLLSYDPADGTLRWKVSRGKARKGDIAGCHERAGGYLRVTISGVAYPAHRLAFALMTGSFPNDEIDHINGVCDDNKWANLRCVTATENARNRALRADNSSGAPGVYRHSRTGRWYAQCCHGGKNRHLGFFGSFEEAARARRKFQMDHGYHENHGRPALAARIAAKKEVRKVR